MIAGGGPAPWGATCLYTAVIRLADGEIETDMHGENGGVTQVFFFKVAFELANFILLVHFMLS